MSAPEISGSIESTLEYVNRWICRFSQYQKGEPEAISDSFSDSNAGEWFVRVVGDPELVEEFVTQPAPIVCNVQSSTPEERSIFEQRLGAIQASIAQTLSATLPIAQSAPETAPTSETVNLSIELNFKTWKQPGDYSLQFVIDPPIANGINHHYSVKAGGDLKASIVCNCSDGSVGMNMLGQIGAASVARPGMISAATLDPSTVLIVTGNDPNGSQYDLTGDAHVQIV